MKQIQSILNELTRRADAADVTGENLSFFVTGKELRDQVAQAVGKVTKDLEKYKSHMEPIEKRVLGTSSTKSMITQFDELTHEVEL